MKKYFLADTDDELVFGDVVTVTLEKQTKKGFHKFVNDVEFSEDNIYFLIDLGVIEERECEEEEENNDLIHFNDDSLNEAFEDLLTDFEALENKVDRIEDIVLNILSEARDYIKGFAKDCPKDKQNTEHKSPKKK